MATVARENIGLLNDKITITVSKEDYFPTFEKKVKEYSKNANIPGFRKGMVPVGMVKKMYGPSIYTDEILKTVEKELYTYLQTEKPDIFAQPLALDADIRTMDHNNPTEYSFGFEIGLKPNFEIAPYSQAKLTFNKVKVTDEMIQEEVERMQQKAGELTEPETIDNEENVLNILLTETDEIGNEIENAVVKENSLLLKYFTPAFQEELKKLQKDGSVITQLNKALDGEKLETVLQDLGFENNDAAAAARYFKLTIVKIGLLQKSELNEEFFNKIFPGTAIATEEDFRNKLKEEFAQHWNEQSRNQLQDQLYHYLLDNTTMEFPASFLKRWIQTNSEKPKTAEEAEAEFPQFSNQLKWTLISDKIVKENGIVVSQEDLKTAMTQEIMRYFGGMSLGDDTSWLDSYVDRMMKDEKQVDASYHRILTSKLFSWVETQVSPLEKEVSEKELTEMMHNHHH